MDLIRAWKFDYVCGHRADAINGLSLPGDYRVTDEALLAETT